MHNRVCHVFLSEVFCLTVPKLLVNESYSFWENFSFRSVFTDEKMGYHIFSSKYFGLKVLKNFLSIPAMFQKNCGIGGIYAYYGNHVSLSKYSGLTVPKESVGIPSMFQKVWGKRKILCIIGVSQFSPKIVFLTVPKKFVKESYCSWESFWFHKDFADEKGGV